jgi:MFS transporter, CP family, cyanate transporter
VTSTDAAPAPALARRDSVLLLGALLLAAVALRPQLVGAGPLIPDIQDDLEVSHAVAGLVGTIPVLCMGVFAPLAGLVSARWGLRTAMAGCLLAIAAFGLGRAVAPGAVVLLGLTLPIGIAMAVAGTLLPVAVKQRFAHRPAFASGIGVAGINIGAAVASAAAVPIASATGGWRGALATFSLATLAICAGWLALSRGAWTERSGTRPPRLPIRRPIVWAIVLAFALPSAVYYALVAWIADAYQERGWSDESSGAVLAVMGIASVPASLVVPWLADRMGSRRLWMWFAAGCMCAATFGFAAIPGGAFAWAVLTGIGLGTVFPICLTMCLDVADEPAEAGAAAALMFLAGYPIAALGPLGAGAVRDLSGSFDASLWALFGTALLMAAILAPLTPRRLRPASGD